MIIINSHKIMLIITGLVAILMEAVLTERSRVY